ncbi:hypothetical protein QQ045_030209 [Rhodiola kirilowii]
MRIDSAELRDNGTAETNLGFAETNFAQSCSGIMRNCYVCREKFRHRSPVIVSLHVVDFSAALCSKPYKDFTISGFRSRNRRISHFQHHCLPIEVASLNQSFRPVAHLYPGSENLVSRRGIWNRRRRVVLRKHGGLGGLEEDEEDRSVELLVRFLQNVFKKISKKARKAVRLVLPVSIPTELVCFSVDGVTMLAFLWLAKAFVEGNMTTNLLKKKAESNSKINKRQHYRG